MRQQCALKVNKGNCTLAILELGQHIKALLDAWQGFVCPRVLCLVLGVPDQEGYCKTGESRTGLPR